VAHEALDYEQALARLLALITDSVRVELSGAEYGYRAGAGFEGVLERGVEDVIERVVGNEEAINFSVVSDSGERRGWFIVGRSSFKAATIVRGPLGDASRHPRGLARRDDHTRERRQALATLLSRHPLHLTE
jgi:hypothetical protein